jgi:hypothetical protein
LEGVGLETHLHKITNIPVFIVLGLNDFDAVNIHYEGHWKGWALKSRLFLAHPFRWPFDIATSKSLRPATYKQQEH